MQSTSMNREQFASFEQASEGGPRTSAPAEPIAIVGMGCRFPGGVQSPEDLWNLLLEGRNAVVPVPPDRWNHEAYHDTNIQKRGRICSSRGGFIDAIDRFDAHFFGISPKEARHMDPQQRILLEVACHALEDAGLRLSDVSGSRTGVFVGLCSQDYATILQSAHERLNIGQHSNTGSAISIASNRISYCLNLKGPSLTLDTACSSTLVAVHLAVQSLRSGESMLTLVGGGNLMLKPELHMGFSAGGFLSPDGHCKSFDASANGYVRSEGMAVVVLKLLSRALADGDRIHAVIRGTAVNQDGRSNGMTVPDPDAQVAMLREAFADAGVSPRLVSYMEAHGTGTPTGDPIEAGSIGRVVGQGRAEGDTCWMGSVKSNIGHLEAGAGLAGMIKLALILKHRAVPPNLHFTRGNPQIPFDELRLRVPTRIEELAAEGPLYGGVNAFGFGGTNAHAVLESPPPVGATGGASESRGASGPSLLTLSARSPDALKAQAESWASFLGESRERLEDICFTAGTRRGGLVHRLAVVGQDAKEMASALASFARGEPGMIHNRATNERRVAFVYSGMGTQWWAMGRQLLASEPAFRDGVERVDAILTRLGGLSGVREDAPRESRGVGARYGSLLDELSASEKDSRINETVVAQPAIFAVQVGLTQLWRELGIRPTAVIGHSIGEVAAAWAAGVLDLEEATRLVLARSRALATAAGKGSMLAVGLSEAEGRRAIVPWKDKLDIAAVNGPRMLTLSGDTGAIEAISAELAKKEIFHRALVVEVPFHSYMMDPMREGFLAALGELHPREGEVPFYSTVKASRVDGRSLDPAYWFCNMRDPVAFHQAVRALARDGVATFLEVGAHPVLSSNVLETLTELQKVGTAIHSLKRKTDDQHSILSALGALVTLGFDPNWQRVAPGRFVDVPRYRWQHESYWLESEESREQRIGRVGHPHLGRVTRPTGDPHGAIWELVLDKRAEPYIEHHRVQGPLVLPGVAHVECALAAARATYGSDFGFLEDVRLHAAVFLPDEGETPRFTLEISSDEGNYAIVSRPRGAGEHAVTVHSSGRMNHLGDRFVSKPAPPLSELRQTLIEPIPIKGFYEEAYECGLQLGPGFQRIIRGWRSPSRDRSISEIVIYDELRSGSERYNVHPTLLDSAIQLSVATVYEDGRGRELLGVYIPTGFQRVRFHRSPESGHCWCYTEVREHTPSRVVADFWIFDESGELVAELQGMQGQYIEGTRLEKKGPERLLYDFHWIAEQAPLPVPPTGRWVVIPDEGGVGTRLATRLRALGAECILADTVEAKETVGLAGVVYLGALDAGQSRAEPADAVGRFSMPVIELARALDRAGASLSRRVWLVTGGAQAVMKDEPVEPLQGALWGLGRTMANEYARIPVTLADVSRSPEDDEIDALARLVLAPSDAAEVALRGRSRYVQRLERRGAPTAARRKNVERLSYRVTPPRTGLLDQLGIVETTRAVPGPGEVEIEVEASGLNFRDVMVSTNLLPPEAIEGGLYGHNLGLEYSGRVTRVGQGVTGLTPGDAVMGFAPASLSRHAISPARYCFRKPAHLTFEDAATPLIVYLTAHYALSWLARIEPGERVLVHAGAGGVGLAAIRLAQLGGAEVHATAGSPEKLAYLQSIGMTHLYGSRTLDFADRVLEATGGRGVDVVLNSLSGSAITQSMKTLAPFGRFIEIGKTDIYRNARIGLKRFGNNLSYFAADIDRLLLLKPDLAARLTREIVTMLEERRIPPLPHHDFPVGEAVAAFQHLAGAKNIGKVVVTMGASELALAPPDTLRLREDGTYLVTGGHGGFGLEVARLLASRGAGNVALMSRSGPRSDEDRRAIAELERSGTRVTSVLADVTDAAAVARAVREIEQLGPPIRGIVHAAMVLDDTTFAELTRERLVRVLSPKVSGAFHLHAATRSAQLDFFVQLSSIAAAFGSPGQGNYAAANAFLDAFAHDLRAQGVAATTVAFGPLGGAGILTRNDKARRMLEAQGFPPITLEQSLEALERAILGDAAHVVVADADWQKVQASFPGAHRFAHLVGSSGGMADGGKQKLLQALQAAEGPDREDLLREAVSGAVARVLGLAVEKLDWQLPLTNVGLDSLMANQLRSWIQVQLGGDYSLMKIMKGPTVIELAHDLDALVAGRPSLPSLPPPAGRWIVRPKSRPEASMRLVCFSYGGGGPSAFQPWGELLPPSIEVCAVQLPGREDRIEEQPIEDPVELSAALAKALEPLLDKPFAFYGHCIGADAAYQLMRADRRFVPLHFFAGASLPPHAPTFAQRFARANMGTDDFDPRRVPESVAHDYMRSIGYPDALFEDKVMLAKVMPSIWAEFALQLGQRALDDGERISCPITVFAGDRDALCNAAELREWERYTSAPFRFETLSGGHLFLFDDRERLLQSIARSLGVVGC